MLISRKRPEVGERGKGKINSNQQDPHLAHCSRRKINNVLSSALGALHNLPSQSPNVILVRFEFCERNLVTMLPATTSQRRACLKDLINMMMVFLVMLANT